MAILKEIASKTKIGSYCTPNMFKAQSMSIENVTSDVVASQLNGVNVL